MSAYPKAKYHRTKGGCCVQNEIEESELGTDWKDSPAEFGVVTAPSAKQVRDAELELHEEKEVEEEPQQETGVGRRRR